MTAQSDWRSAFPLGSAADAVDALLDAWKQLVADPPPKFNRRTREPTLTQHLKVFLADYVSHERGLLGTWMAEDVIGKLDPVSRELVEIRRTDIAYAWNNEIQSLRLVFEFKRVGELKRHRDAYLGKEGLERFVTGIYARKQSVAVMVGILLAPEGTIVPTILASLSEPSLAKGLRLRSNTDGKPYTQPSTLFPSAAFDTEHDRDPTLAPKHGYIRVAHFFVTFD